MCAFSRSALTVVMKARLVVDAVINRGEYDYGAGEYSHEDREADDEPQHAGHTQRLHDQGCNQRSHRQDQHDKHQSSNCPKHTVLR